VLYDRLIVLAGIVIGALIGVGIGSVVGAIEIFALAGAGFGAAWGVVRAVRHDKLAEKRPDSRARPSKRKRRKK